MDIQSLDCIIHEENDHDNSQLVQSNAEQIVYCPSDSHLNILITTDQTDNGIIKNYNTESTVEPNSVEPSVLIARPSQPMVHRMLRRDECSIMKDGKVNSFCFLCEKMVTLTVADWKQHILLHTGEKPFYCIECRTPQSAKESHGNCHIASVVDIFDEPASSSALKAYICKWCNLMQVHKVC